MPSFFNYCFYRDAATNPTAKYPAAAAAMAPGSTLSCTHLRVDSRERDLASAVEGAARDVLQKKRGDREPNFTHTYYNVAFPDISGNSD